MTFFYQYLSFFFIYFFVLYLNKYSFIELEFVLFCLLGFLINMYYWFFDIIIESTYFGRYNRKIRSSILFGFFLFLISEIMLFSGFFWSYFDRIFHLSTYTFNSSQLNGFEIINWFNVPYIATIVLLTSGYYLNLSYYYLRYNSYYSKSYLLLTILLAYFFLSLQLEEYKELTFSISDNVYCSLFFLLTGFHGMHVLVGTIFLVTSYERLTFSHFSNSRNLGFSIALIYWHFVDIIWILLFIVVYILNNLQNDCSFFLNDHFIICKY